MTTHTVTVRPTTYKLAMSLRKGLDTKTRQADGLSVAKCLVLGLCFKGRHTCATFHQNSFSSCP